MNVLILTFGSRGDVQPYIALGKALEARGHDVTLSTGQGFETDIEAHGLRAAPLSVDVRALLQAPEMQKALRSISARFRAYRASRGMARRLLDDMWAVAREHKPDVIVYHIKAYAAPDIAEALQAVAVPSFQIPGFVPTGAFPSPLLPVPDLGAFANRLSHKALLGIMRLASSRMIKAWRRATLGLGPAKRWAPYAGFAPGGRAVDRLHGYSRHVLPMPTDWGAEDRVTGYWFLDQATGWEPPQPLLRFLDQGPPPVYVGFGSMPAEDGERLTRLVLDALERSGQRGVLATGWGGLDATANSDRVHVLDRAPHDWLFPRCAAVVHHGGAGTTHEGLRWGRPSIICPVFGDQPFWGRRVMELGAGPTPLPQKRLTAEGLAAALEAVKSPAMASRAAEIGAAIREEPGAEAAAAAIDALAAAR